MFERRLYYYIDWALLAAILALCALGVTMIYSTTSDPTRQASLEPGTFDPGAGSTYPDAYTILLEE